VGGACPPPREAPTPATPLRAQLSEQDLTQRERRRPAARRGLPEPAATARAVALVIYEVEAGLPLRAVRAWLGPVERADALLAIVVASTAAPAVTTAA
jgi:hypothetical protein